MISRRTFLQISGTCVASLCASVFLPGCSAADTVNEFITKERVLTDDTGRNVTVPTTSALNSIYFTSALAQIFCFTVAPDLLAGTAIPFEKSQLEYLPAGTEQLAYLGSLSQGGVIDTDMLTYKKVQIIFSISGTDLTDVNVDDALSLQSKTGIPVFLIDGSFKVIADTYRLLGKCLGRQSRAEELASYCENAYQRVTEAVSTVPRDKLVSYYFAEGPEGLQTEPDTSQHSLAFQAARGQNVAANYPMPEGIREMVPTSIEQVKRWDPDFIICWDAADRNGATDLIRASSNWSELSAVKNKRVIAMPDLPFAFCDRPPAVNRFLGIQWLANLFYPDYFDIDMVATVREFYSKCYWCDISDAQARRILNMDA